MQTEADATIRPDHAITRKHEVNVVVIVTLAFAATFVALFSLYWLQSAPQRIAMEAVRHKLFDPASAAFRAVYVKEDGTTVCGEVVTQDPVGGLNGYDPFVVLIDSDKKASALLGETPIWETFCGRSERQRHEQGVTADIAKDGAPA